MSNEPSVTTVSCARRLERQSSDDGESGAPPPGPTFLRLSNSPTSPEISFDRNIWIVRAPQLPYVTSMATNAILSQEELETMKRAPESTARPKAAEVAVQIADQINARRWQAVLERDGAQI